jgi:hypothetical protein
VDSVTQPIVRMIEHFVSITIGRTTGPFVSTTTAAMTARTVSLRTWTNGWHAIPATLELFT